MQKLLLLTGILLIISAHAESHTKPLEGCYLTSEIITSFTSEESKSVSSYIKISKVSDDYYVEGIVWGANFHVCHIGSPIEGTDDPLPMKMIHNKLTYTEVNSEFNINCQLEVSFSENTIHISDTNHDCSNYIFYCGARVGLNGIELPKFGQQCPDIN